jgi:hypothetical protein
MGRRRRRPVFECFEARLSPADLSGPLLAAADVSTAGGGAGGGDLPPGQDPLPETLPPIPLTGPGGPA